jgi:hypothetical protein
MGNWRNPDRPYRPSHLLQRSEVMHLTAHFLIWLLCLLAIAGVVWWCLQQIPLPQPIRIIVVVVFAIIATLILLDLASGGPGISVSSLPQIARMLT